MMHFDPERFVQQLMAKLNSLDFNYLIETPINLASDEIVAEDQPFRTTVIAFVQAVYKHLPNSLDLTDAHAWTLGNQMLDLAYPTEEASGSTTAYLDYTTGDICTAEHLYSTLSCGLNQHLQNLYTQTIVSEQLAGLSFTERMAIALYVQPQYQQLGIMIPAHYLAHSLSSVMIQLSDSNQHEG